MLRKLLLLPVCCLLLATGFPAAALAFDLMVVPSVTDPQLDVWQHVPTGTAPALYPAKRVYRQQPFRLLVLAREFATDSLGSANIDYSVRIVGPDGDPVLASDQALELYRGKVGAEGALLLSRQHLSLDFSAADPLGDYRFEITARDRLGEATAAASATLTLADSATPTAFASEQELTDWLTNYYRSPDPLRVFAALEHAIDPEKMAGPEQQALLVFLTRVVRDNPFLWPLFSERYAAVDPSGRKRLLLLDALLGETVETGLQPETAELVAYAQEVRKIRLPAPTAQPQTELEINTLWAEFMATGTLTPIRNLIGALHLESTRGAQEQLAQLSGDPPAELLVRAARESVYQAALGSLLGNGEKHSLVRQYLGYLYEQQDPQSVIASQLNDILDILRKRTNEEAARQHLEQQQDEAAAPAEPKP